MWQVLIIECVIKEWTVVELAAFQCFCVYTNEIFLTSGSLNDRLIIYITPFTAAHNILLESRMCLYDIQIKITCAF